MKAQYLTIILAIVLAGSVRAPDTPYEQALKALAAKDWDKALTLLETALAADADNIRYASEYRQAVLARAKALHPTEGQPGDFDRSLSFFAKLATDHPQSSTAYLNYGFAYVDKIPAAGAISQLILANSALAHFTRSIELNPTWIGYYTRGNSYLSWPRIFNRAALGVSDLEECLKIQKTAGSKPYYVRAWIALGDGYWKTDQLERAKATWAEGLKQFPENDALKQRMARQGDVLKDLIDDSLDPSKRVDTNLKELWMDR